MTNYIIIGLIIITVLTLVSSIYKDTMHNKQTKDFSEERKDLLNRIMAKNIVEYSNINNDTLPKGKNSLKNKTLRSEFKDEGFYE